MYINDIPLNIDFNGHLSVLCFTSQVPYQNDTHRRQGDKAAIDRL